jgi:hypothetical protein
MASAELPKLAGKNARIDSCVSRNISYAGQQADIMRTLLESEPKLKKAPTLYKRFTQNKAVD